MHIQALKIIQDNKVPVTATTLSNGISNSKRRCLDALNRLEREGHLISSFEFIKSATGSAQKTRVFKLIGT